MFRRHSSKLIFFPSLKILTRSTFFLYLKSSNKIYVTISLSLSLNFFYLYLFLHISLLFHIKNINHWLIGKMLSVHNILTFLKLLSYIYRLEKKNYKLFHNLIEIWSNINRLHNRLHFIIVIVIVLKIFKSNRNRNRPKKINI